MVGIFGVVQEKRGWRSDIEDRHIDVAIIIDVAEGYAPARLDGSVVQTRGPRDLIERAITLITVKQERFTVLDVLMQAVDVRRDVAGCDEQVRQAVIVKIDEARAPRNIRLLSLREFGSISSGS